MSYFLQLVTASAVEIVTAADFAVFSRGDATAEVALVKEMIASALWNCEKFTKRSFLQTVWCMYLDDFPVGDVIQLPKSPVSAVASVKYYDSAGVLTTMSSADYQTDLIREPARIALVAGKAWPAVQTDKLNGVEIAFTAGYGDEATDVPERLKLAVKFLAEYYFENRLAKEVDSMPEHIKSMLRRYQVK